MRYAIAKLVNVEQQLETAKIEVKKPFPQEQELNDKLTRLAELNSLLDMDEKGEDAVDLDEDVPKPEPEKETIQQTETEAPVQEADSEADHISEDKAEISEKAVVAAMDHKAPAVAKKKEEVIA